MRVVIVDDQPCFRRAARELLAARGFTVVAEADCQAAALALLDPLEPDAVMLDVRLGDESGYDVARALIHARPGLPVLLVAADEDLLLPAAVRACGARAGLTKTRIACADLRSVLRCS